MAQLPNETKFSAAGKRARYWISRHRVELLLFTLIWTTYASFYQATGDNEAARLDQLRALVEDHTLKIDQYWWNSADVIRYPPEHGSIFPNKAPGTTVLLAPAYALVAGVLTPLRWLGVPEWLYWHLVVYLLTVFSISLLTALAGVAMYRVLVELTGDRHASVLGVIAIWLGTLLFPFATLFFSHALAAALLVFGFYFLFRLRQSDGALDRARLAGAAGAGLCLSGSVMTEYPTAVAVAVLSLYAAWIGWRWKISRRDKVFFAGTFGLGLAVGGLILIGYNWLAFGKPFYVPYESYAQAGQHFHATYARGWLGINWAGRQHFFKALGAITIFPPIGLLYIKVDAWRIYACNPVLWICIPGIAIMLWRRAARPEGLLVPGLTVAYLVFLTSYGSSIYDWAGASYLGPRHLIPLLPFLALPIGFAVRKFSWLFYPLLGLSVFYMLLGTAVEPRVPYPFAIPARDLLLPDYLHGKLSQNAHHLFDSGQHLLTRDSTAFNLAKLAGVPGRAQLVPLMFWWALLGGTLLLLTRERRRLGAIAILCLYLSAIGAAPAIDHARSAPKDTAHGLIGKYYRNSKWSGPPVDVQLDPAIDFDWSKSMPLNPPFSVRWSGRLLVEQPGEYEFALRADDGAALEIDGHKLIPLTAAWQEKTARLHLAAGFHSIRVDYFNDLFGGFVHLWWTLTSRPKQIVPPEALFPDQPVPNDGKTKGAG